jgi:protocatechuate 3,4-dioxygenase beta subunit
MRTQRQVRLGAGVIVAVCAGWGAAAAAPVGAGEGSAVPSVVLASSSEPGERLLFSGRVLDEAGRPISRAAVLAYHADLGGHYNAPGAGTRVPRLRGVSVTDGAGRFRFSTIRPGPYPDGSEPAHIHLEITAAAYRVHYTTFWFAADPRVTAEQRRRAERDAEIVIVPTSRDSTGCWSFSYDIRLEPS